MFVLTTSPLTTMKMHRCALFLILIVQINISCCQIGLEYVLKSLEHLTSLHPGVFSCVFYDVAQKNPFDNILNDLLISPRLGHVVKYVIGGMYDENLEQLPLNPTLVVVHPGMDLRYFKRKETMDSLAYVMRLFDPTTKVLIFVNFFDQLFVEYLESVIRWCTFSYVVYLDTGTMFARLSNGVWSWHRRNVPPLELFSYGRRSMERRKITFIVDSTSMKFFKNVQWIQVVADYLNTEPEEFLRFREPSAKELASWFEDYSTSSIAVDIVLYDLVRAKYFNREFRLFSTNLMRFTKIAVPRDRPLNTLELMLIPFSHQVWILLVIILVASEIAKRLFPKQLKNDPILLVVCGFERRELHQAGRWEKVIFLPLIILMFFLSNAFETKIISMMVSKPSIQRIKTMDDLHESGLKFYADLDNFPEHVNHSLLGKIAVQGNTTHIFERNPDAAMIWPSHLISLFHDMSFDYERMQPFYVVLEGDHYDGIEMYGTSLRCPLLEVFRYIHSTLVEAGLMDLWTRQYICVFRLVMIGQRLRVDIADKDDLNFHDMQIAWLIIGIGLGISVVGFVGELLLHGLKKCKFLGKHVSRKEQHSK